MLDYARLRPGPGFRPARAALYYGQRLVTHPGMRRLVSQGIAAGIGVRHPAAKLPGAADGATTADACDNAVSLLNRDGFALLGDLLPASAIAEIAAFLREKDVVAPDGSGVPLERVPSGTRMAAYPLDTVLTCPHVLELVNHPAALRLAAGYLGCAPTVSSIGIRWSLPSAGDGDATQRFHRDPDDWRFLKLFVYLTDVDEESGPHMYVAGSHRSAARLRARAFRSEEIEHRYGRNAIRTVTGPRGTVFAADTYGIHRGAPPRSRPRLILQVQYSLLPIFAFLYRPVPVALPRPFDPYINRLLVAR
ncbi:MAG TPA: phytanoyl-CoA dioxygenase family protein [Stellaceae bacterium]